MGYKIKKIKVKNFRSINELTIDYNENELMTICGANNVGKTNFIRALDLFFSLDPNKFSAENDIPYHIVEGSRGRGFKTDVTITFEDEDTSSMYKITTTYTRSKGENVLDLKGYKSSRKIDNQTARDIILSNRFFLVESNNIDLPELITKIVEEEVLPDLDRLRSRQNEPLRVLEDFISKSKNAVTNIENDITSYFKQYVDDIDGMNSEEWLFKIVFPDFNYLREAISNLINFTLYDTNDRALEHKGSGIQRMLLLALITYVSNKYSGKVIWAIDEPEAFLQPSLQKKVFNELKKLVKENIDIIITTHSPHFVDISNVNYTFLFNASQEKKIYERKNDTVFIKNNTYVNQKTGAKKVEAIKKHMGIERNDSWYIVPYNLLVEGEIDKEYLISLGELFNLEVPNILVAGSADKIPGYIEFVREFSKELSFKPRIVCLLDHDEAGKSKFDTLKNKANRTSELSLEPKYVKRCDNDHQDNWEYEIEDLVYSDLIFEATTQILRNKDYYGLLKHQRKNRFAASYKRINILKYITQIVPQRNTHKEILDFESQGLKYYLCERTTSLINSLDSERKEDLNNKQPIVKEFVKELFGYN
ncbi:ATP-dependent nuclease [Natranaerobius trueperi]|uniref:ATP-dependent nuclease n=1 Tax=Natranaerobius trueperi TaxID=759412 RepID=UPI0013039452|nr:AAA family ATPase [Natranaerobius trueperi]